MYDFSSTYCYEALEPTFLLFVLTLNFMFIYREDLLGREADQIQIYQGTFIALDRLQACRSEDVHVKLENPIQLVSRTPLTALATEDEVKNHNDLIMSYRDKSVEHCVNEVAQSLNIDAVVSSLNNTKESCKRLKLTFFD